MIADALERVLVGAVDLRTELKGVCRKWEGLSPRIFCEFLWAFVGFTPRIFCEFFVGPYRVFVGQTEFLYIFLEVYTLL